MSSRFAPGIHDHLRVGWSLSLVPAAGEAGGCFVSAYQRHSVGIKGAAANPERSGWEASRRARRNIRRYAVANGLNRLGTLTYRGEGCHDPVVFRADMRNFWRALRRRLDGLGFAYVWVPEWHPGGHGLHAHFAVGRFIKRSDIEAAWPHGFVHIKLLGDLPVGSGRLAESRRAAGYLSKYVAKSFEDTRRIAGSHRYDLAQKFNPTIEKIWGRSEVDVIDQACEVMGSNITNIFRSADHPDWQGPPWVSLRWD